MDEQKLKLLIKQFNSRLLLPMGFNWRYLNSIEICLIVSENLVEQGVINKTLITRKKKILRNGGEKSNVNPNLTLRENR